MCKAEKFKDIVWKTNKKIAKDLTKKKYLHRIISSARNLVAPLPAVQKTIARFPSPSWIWDSRGRNCSNFMENSSTFEPYSSAIIRRLLTKNVSLKR